MDPSKIIAIPFYSLLGISIVCGIIVHFFKTQSEKKIVKIGLYSFYLVAFLGVFSAITAVILQQY